MTIQEECVLGNINKTKISSHEKRITTIERLIFWLFSTSIGTLITAVILLIKEVIAR